jgi:UPF0755 protein
MKHYLAKHRLLVAAFLLIGVLLIGIIMLYRFTYHPLLSNREQFQTIKVYKADRLSSLAEKLHQRHLLAHPLVFKLYAKLHDYDRLLKVGEYGIEPGMTPPALLKNIIQGKVIVHTIQFIEGWTFKQFETALEQNPSLKHTLKGQSGAEIMKRLHSQYKNPEGLFFPDTYVFTWGDSDFDILKRSYDRMQSILNFEWKRKKLFLPYRNEYQALIVASLIETEARVDDEREKISGIIARRLKKWMHLQIDAAINYGLGYPYGQKLTKADLKKDTPYNTYLHYRLPPTPICMPGAKSIHAALHPDDSDALYYVARGDGAHVFSKNYVEQRKAINIYQLNTDKE